MPTITIRNVPAEVVANVKVLARARGWSMEQELRQLLQQRYTVRARAWARIDQLRAKMVGALPLRELVEARHEGRRR